MDADLIKKALCFHGKPMQKIWDDERGSGDLQQLGVPEDGNYTIYMERQKHFTFQDRAKRLKLHQFLARKAADLYDTDLVKSLQKNSNTVHLDEKERANLHIAQMPPYETVMPKKSETKSKILRHSLESIQSGDIVYAIVVRAKNCNVQKIGTSSVPIIVKPLCTGEPCVRLLYDCNIKAFIPGHLCGPIALDKLGKPRPICNNDYVCCEIVEFSIDAERMTLSLEHTINKYKNFKLGLITQEELPQLYRKSLDNSLGSYEDRLCKAREFKNPNYDTLYAMNGLDVNDIFSLMGSLKFQFPRHEYAKELRQVQASKWAFRSVAEGIEFFKIGQHVEAFQCLNKALNIDPRNVEGLVARGALYANKGSFLKAVADFEKALKLNAYHVNARKYMGETLVALGRSYEEDNRIQDAAKAYRDCLNIIPNHEQARLSLEAIQQRTGAIIEPLVTGTIYDNPYPPIKLTENEMSCNRKAKVHSPQSSANESNASASSSESQSDSSEEQQPSTSKKGNSLSPLSKKIALHSTSLDKNNKEQQIRFNQPFYMTQTVSSNVIPNEFKLDEDDTGSRVRRLLQEASKHKKEKKKSKKKKNKKAKKESKTNNKEASTNAFLDKISFEEAYKLLGGVDVCAGTGTQHSESKLNENIKLYEQTIAEIKRKQEELQANSVHKNNNNEKYILATGDRQKSETPPEPPSMRLIKSESITSNIHEAVNSSIIAPVAPPPPTIKPEPPKFSFQIRKPVKVDKFGLVRLATPALPKSPTLSPERPTRRSRSRRRSINHHRSRSRSRSQSYNRHRRRSTSRSRSPYGSRRQRTRRGRYSSRSPRSRSRTRSPRSRKSARRDRNSYRRSPSPIVTRSTLSPRSRHRRSRSPRISNSKSSSSRRSSPPAQSQERHSNRTWSRPGYKPQNSSPPHHSTTTNKPTSDTIRWLHDKFEDKNDGPSIEEIDEIINRAQKERKEEIIKRDKNILKKPTGNSF